MSVITIEKKVLEKNDAVAASLRDSFNDKKIFSFNLLSSPGSGKTSIVEKTISYLKEEIKIAVVEGDVQTNLDAERIGKLGVDVVQIVTNGACHLEAPLVKDAVSNLELTGVDLLIIENVGNLVCPSSYDLGEDCKVVVLSITEGDDKPLKYPAIFRRSSVLLINKIDLLPYLQSSVDTIKKNALSINPGLKIFEISCTSGEGFDDWLGWLKSNLKK